MPSTAARPWRTCWRVSLTRMPDPQTLLLVLTIAIALLFDFTNGFHDTANAVGTAIGTRALPPRFAVGLTAILNLVGAIVTTQFLHAEVANTVGSLVAPAGGVAMSMLIAVLFGAIAWNLFTWRAGLPSSSSHALIGALIGMGLAVYGLDAVQWDEVYPVFIALVTSPVVGLLIAYVRVMPMACSVGFSSSPAVSLPLATGLTTHRRRWPSLPSRCSAQATSQSSSSRCGWR